MSFSQNNELLVDDISPRVPTVYWKTMGSLHTMLTDDLVKVEGIRWMRTAQDRSRALCQAVDVFWLK